MSNMIELDNNNFQSFIESHKDKIILLYFGAEWCGPCKKVHPIMDEISIEHKEQIMIGHIDITKSPEIAQKYIVISIPQIIILKSGEEKDRILGVLPKNKILDKIKLAMN